MRTSYKITNEQFIEEYVVNGLGSGAISKKYNLSKGTVSARLKRLVRYGKISQERVNRNKSKRNISDVELTKLYLDQQLGILSIGKIIGRATSSVRIRLFRLGILDSSRQFKRSLAQDALGAPDSTSSPIRPRNNVLLKSTAFAKSVISQ